MTAFLFRLFFGQPDLLKNSRRAALRELLAKSKETR